MICKVLVEHSELDRARLKTHLAVGFNNAPELQAADWKAGSLRYKEAKGVENSLIWGSQGESLYGVLQETPNSTLMWIEYSASKDWAFSHFRGVLINFATAIMKSQRKLGRLTRQLTVKESKLYVENENDSLGVTVRIVKEAKLVPGITLKESFVSGALAALAIYGQYQMSRKAVLQYLSEVEFWSLPIPVYGWFLLLLWGTLAFVINLCTRQIEVKFDA